jgi:hypothetical protein
MLPAEETSILSIHTVDFFVVVLLLANLQSIEAGFRLVQIN